MPTRAATAKRRMGFACARNLGFRRISISEFARCEMILGNTFVALSTVVRGASGRRHMIGGNDIVGAGDAIGRRNSIDEGNAADALRRRAMRRTIGISWILAVVTGVLCSREYPGLLEGWRRR